MAALRQCRSANINLTAELGAMKADTVGGPKCCVGTVPTVAIQFPNPGSRHSSKFIIHRRANTASIMTWIGPFSARSSIHSDFLHPKCKCLLRAKSSGIIDAIKHRHSITRRRGASRLSVPTPSSDQIKLIGVRSSAHCFVLDCADYRREYGPASAACDRL